MMKSPIASSTAAIVVSAAAFLFLPALAAEEAQPGGEFIATGVARVDITPEHPVRLSGFAFRRDEAASARTRLYARALAFGEGDETSVWLTVDSIGIPAWMTADLAERLNRKAGLARQRLAVSATHSHTAPCLSRMINTLFGVDIPAEHQANIDRYTTTLQDKLEEAALAALADRRPARWEWGVGSAGFAINRRTRGGPVDHTLPVLRVVDPSGAPRAIAVSYACHCVVLSDNQVSGDWAGYAAEQMERSYPGSVALVAIGCGADANPASGVTGDKAEVAIGYGAEIASGVEKVFSQPMRPVRGPIRASWKEISLPFQPLPTRQEWEQRAKQEGAVGYHARQQLARLDRGEEISEQLPYAVQSWVFGDDLAMVFLPGEVVVDYALRLRRELDADRLWINAYSNDCPCYIPSERILKEGGYEGGGAMIYYDRPGSLASGVENLIVQEVRRQLPESWISDEHKAKFPPALSPIESQGALRVKPGLKVELAAAEPLVTSPVAIDFGTDGRLWVAEMYDYPQGLKGDYQPGGRVRVLWDDNDDGRYDRSELFLEGIPFPTGLMAWRDGVLVCAAPDVLFAADRDGDGAADHVEKLLSGFVTENYQARVNGLTYGLDNWVYGANGLLGGEITSTRAGTTTPIGGRDFRFRPDTGEFEPAAGLTQQGRTRDDWQNWIGGNNSVLAFHFPLDDHYVRRNPHSPGPSPSVAIARGDDPNRLFPRSVILERFNDPDNAGRVTSACSPSIYRDRLLGDAYYGDLFVCEPVHNLVTRRKVVRQGVLLTGQRTADEQDSEFLASTDNWFRPVQVRTGPDGALWVVDMYRFVIEHPRWITPERLAELDVRAGADRGRIYRILPESAPARPWPKLASASGEQLVAALDSPNGIVRDMAHREIAHRQGRSLAAPVARIVQRSPAPASRVQGLGALESIGGLDADILLTALNDEHPEVRRLAARFSEPHLNSDPRLGQALARLANDKDAQVRLQAACSLGSWADPASARTLAGLAIRDAENTYIQGAVLSSLNDQNVGAVFAEVWRSAPDEAVSLKKTLASMAAASGDAKAVARAIGVVVSTPPENATAAQWEACGVLLDGVQRRRLDWEAAAEDVAIVSRLQEYQAFARNRLLEDGGDPADPAVLRASIQVLARDQDRLSEDLDLLGRLLSAQYAIEIQSAAIARLGSLVDVGAADRMLSSWTSLGPKARTEVLDALLARPASTMAMLDAIESGRLPPGAVDLARRQQLERHAESAIKDRSAKLWGGGSASDKAPLIARYAAQIAAGSGDSVRGEAIFKKHCANCHRLKEAGFVVGPDLAALTDRSPGALITAVLDPSKDVDSRYHAYALQTTDGRSFSGILVEETGSSVTLLAQEGKKETVLRRDIEVMAASGKSLMPDGMEKEIPPPEMADLLAFLAGSSPPPKSIDGNRPALVSAAGGGAVVLPAASAEIYGGEITFERPLENIGYWHHRNDHIAWSFLCERQGEFDLVLHYSCDDGAAGNPFEILVAGQTLQHKVEGTGGWANYRAIRLGAVRLDPGVHRLVMKPTADIRGALADVKAIELVPR